MEVGRKRLWANRLSSKMSSVWRNVHGANRPWGETSIHEAKRPWGEKSINRTNMLQLQLLISFKPIFFSIIATGSASSQSLENSFQARTVSKTLISYTE